MVFSPFQFLKVLASCKLTVQVQGATCQCDQRNDFFSVCNFTWKPDALEEFEVKVKKTGLFFEKDKIIDEVTSFETFRVQVVEPEGLEETKTDPPQVPPKATAPKPPQQKEVAPDDVDEGASLQQGVTQPNPPGDGANKANGVPPQQPVIR